MSSPLLLCYVGWSGGKVGQSSHQRSKHWRGTLPHSFIQYSFLFLIKYYQVYVRILSFSSKLQTVNVLQLILVLPVAVIWTQLDFHCHHSCYFHTLHKQPYLKPLHWKRKHKNWLHCFERCHNEQKYIDFFNTLIPQLSQNNRIHIFRKENSAKPNL